MPLIENWWTGEIDWETPAGQLLKTFLATLPMNRRFHLTLYGSAPLQLTVDRQLMSGDVDLFSDDDEDLSSLVAAAKLDKSHGGFYLEPGFELSFRTSPRWRGRAATVQRGNVTLTIPHPLDILIGKLDRLDAKDLRAFERVIQLTGHPTAAELRLELQTAVDLFRPAFDEDSPNRYPENTRRLWHEIFHAEIDIRSDIIEPAIARRKQGYGETPPDYKRALGE
ncbi:hypothetical protein [Pedosphaera parvula]|uniref:Uncharacterized protein n=1 Tax=Pedosphaera parvula (strain Ellin514) TaxID=320771 RepID=B9XR89_PEDPL|nr:hypothetical protein [Pedosphaera parvula]EEF57632.1 hypothetical protein Cflav_PD0737 [Pedosphaera parvula Ellin514]